jgi:hypothetical protein
MPTRPPRLTLTFAALAAAAALALCGGTALAAATAPTATTGAASSVTYQSAIIASTVNPEGKATEVYFEYGTTTAYGTESPPDALPAGTKSVAVTATITGLAADTTYDYRVVAVSSGGTTEGAPRSFKTAKIPLSLAITADPNPATYGGLVTIEGTLAGTGNADQAVALEQNPFPYTAGFTQLGNAELTSSTGAYSFTIASLLLNTEYEVVTVAQPTVASAIVDEGDSVATTLHARGVGTRAHPAARFSGTVAPGIETDAKIAIERLEGTRWVVVGGSATSNRAHGAVTRFSVTVRFHRPGFFRVYVAPVEGSHVVGRSGPLFARGYA